MVLKSLIHVVFIAFVLNICSTYSQIKSPVPILNWSTWLILQTVPSVTFYQDKGNSNSTLRTGFQWQIIPLSYTFSTNKYLSHFNSFFIRPVKRFTGSAELYFQPEYVFGGFKYLQLKKYMFKSGVRCIFPVAQQGEYLAFSIGGGYNYQSFISGENKSSPTIEAAVYSLFGMLGLKCNYNPNAISKYSFGLYIKYY